MNPARAPITNAIASAFRGNEKSRELGRFHALLGLTWSCPEGTDMLAYSLGYADGRAERGCCGGGLAQVEWTQ